MLTHNANKGRTEILLVEDSPTDALMLREAFDFSKIRINLHLVENGADALMFLRRQERYVDAVRPDLILLDLNLPKKNGKEVLKEIKTDKEMSAIPVIVLSTSNAEDDIVNSYNLHANCYIAKPVEFDEFVEIAKAINDFWFCLVTLPKREI